MSKRAVDILIIESDRVLAGLYADTFRGAGYTVKILRDFDTIQSQVETIRPRLIFFDLFLPKADGFIVLEILRRDPRLAQIPLVVCTRFGKRDEVKTALDLGVHEYLIQSHTTLADILHAVSSHLRPHTII